MTAPITPRKSPVQSRSKYMVGVILEATAKVLVQYGYAKTNTNLIAKQANISVGSVYQYFPNKEAIIFALHERQEQQMSIMLESRLNEHLHTPQRLYTMISHLVWAMFEAHLLYPRLHAVLENECHFYMQSKEQFFAQSKVAHYIESILHDYKAQIRVSDIHEAIWVVRTVLESLIHATVNNPPKGMDRQRIEMGAVHAILGYLTYS